MDIRNHSTVTEFILLGFTGSHIQQIARFIIVLIVYVVSLLGNSVMIIIVCLDHRLHTPMYFFLWNVSLLETANISIIVPLMLVQTFTVNKSISIVMCLTQSFFYVYVATVDFFLLPIMSYDRYVAICNPLRYTTIVNGKLCFQLLICSWLGPLLFMMCPVILIARLPFCGPNIVNHFFCDSLAIVKLACANTGVIEVIIGISALIVLLSSLGLTVVSYIFIISAVLRIPSTNGKQKAFSTCSSQLTMATISYGSAIFTELSPQLNPSVEVYKTVHIFSSLLAVLMNPFVYTFRNKQVKEVLKERLRQKSSSRSFVP